MRILIFSFFLLLLVLVIWGALKPSHREYWFKRLASRDRVAFQRLVRACGNNEELAEKMVKHEMLLDERATRQQAVMRAIGTIENYRQRGVR
ncbi:dephospho-CoA kinase [Vogesella perlucida]|jgi:dephospho-CoA kinase|nr:dephospho-CoA kinase [Vogesella perlucida]